MSRPSDLLAQYGLRIDHSETQVIVYDTILGVTVNLPLDMAEVFLDEYRYHVANARLHTLDEES